MNKNLQRDGTGAELNCESGKIKDMEKARGGTINLAGEQYNELVVNLFEYAQRNGDPLLRPEGIFQTVADKSLEGILALDKKGAVIFANPAAEIMFGRGRDKLTGQKVVDFCPEPGRAAEVDIIRRDGSPGTGYVTVTETEHNQGTVRLAVIRDITPFKETEERIEKSYSRVKKMLKKLQQMQHQIVEQERLRVLGQVVSGIAHEFNNALSPVLGFSEVLLARPEILNNKVKTNQYLEMINAAGKNASQIVSRLREFYRYRSEAERFDPVDLKQVIEQAVTLSRHRWSLETLERNIAIAVNTDLGDVGLIKGNEIELREIVINFIYNAVDAMPRGGEIIIRTRARKDAVVLEVSDTGTGMSQEVQERCLEPFFTTKETRGTGLGLAVSYGIVRRHNGKIEIESAPGKGTTVRVLFLRNEETPAFVEAVEQDSLPPQLHVLVVDDEAQTRDLLSEYLRLDGHTVETAVNGQEGLQKFYAGRFDVIVTAKAMPEMNGDQMAACIKKTAPQKPILMLTGFGQKTKYDIEKPQGVDALATKPITLEEFEKALVEAIARTNR